MRRLCTSIVFWAFPAVCFADPGFTIGQNFVGADLGDVLVLNNDNFLRTPAPDVNGGVGRDHVVMFIKGAYRVWDKRSGAMVQSINDVDFWNRSFTNNGLTYQTVQTRGPSDPRILFDRQTDRWFAVGIDKTGTKAGVLNIAVSENSNPAGNWRGFTLQNAFGGWCDFDTVGIDGRGIFVSSAIYDPFDGYRTTQLSHVPMPNLLSAHPDDSNAIQVSMPIFIAQPAVAMNPRPANAPLPILSTDSSVLRFGRISDLPSDPVTFTPVSPSVQVTPGGFASQLGAQPVSALDNRLLSSIVLQGSELWGVSHSGSGIKWFRINADTGATIEQGVIQAVGLKLFFPSIAVDDDGDVVIGLNGSNGAQYISSYAAAGRTVGNVTHFGELTRLVPGQSSYFMLDGSGRNRWGDYSTTVIDPTETNVFWTFQEVPNAPRFVPELGRTVTNNRAIWITQVFVPEPAMAAVLALLICLRPRDRSANPSKPPTRMIPG